MGIALFVENGGKARGRLTVPGATKHSEALVVSMRTGKT